MSDKPNLLAVMSIFESTFSIDWLLEMTQMKATRILEVLKRTVAEGLLIESDTGLYRFCDQKKRLKLRSQLSESEITELHRKAVPILTSDEADDPVRLVELSHHLLNAPTNLENCGWLRNVGKLYIEQKDFKRGIDCYSKIINDLKPIRGDEADLLFIQTVNGYMNLVDARQESEWASKNLEEALARAESIAHVPYQALMKMHLALNQWLRNRFQKSDRNFKEGWRLAQDFDDPKFLKPMTSISTIYYFWQGRYRDAVAIYEKSMQNVESFSKGMFPLYASTAVAHSYACCGQVNLGLGMLDAIHNHCIKIKNFTLAEHALLNVGWILLLIGRFEEALELLSKLGDSNLVNDDERLKNEFNILLAYAYFRVGKEKESVSHFRDYLQSTLFNEPGHTIHIYCLVLCSMMARGQYLKIEGYSAEKEIERAVASKNKHIQAFGCRYQASIWYSQNKPFSEILASLRRALKFFEDSGSKLDLAWTRIEIARVWLEQKNRRKAAREADLAAEIFNSFRGMKMPDDLKFLVGSNRHRESVLDEAWQLGQDVVAIQREKGGIQHILATINRITMAERGAIFLLGADDSQPPLLKAAQNLTVDDLEHRDFAESMETIKAVIAGGKGMIHRMEQTERPQDWNFASVRSCVCVPMIVKQRIVGALYHDNRFLSSVFQESDLKMFTYFAAMVAIALDNDRAYDEIRRLNHKLKEEKQYYKEQHLDSMHFGDFVGKSLAIISALNKVQKVAKTEATVLITGETGVGKELMAGLVLDSSLRKDKPFICVNCSVFTEALIASELFGHEKGAFTGANERHVGRFELADGGTIFLDEIGDIPMEVQVRLLRVLQTREFERVGGTRTLRSDFRLIAATNQNLEQLVKTGRFREDLFYRLNVFPIEVPPLRLRKEDIQPLALYFLSKYSKKLKMPPTRISKREMKKLLKYSWPGNVRELENVIERAVIMSPSSELQVPELIADNQTPVPGSGATTLVEMEMQHIAWALEKTNWKVRGPGGAAELLDINPSTLRWRIKKHDIKR